MSDLTNELRLDVMTEPEVETTPGARARIRLLAKWTIVSMVLVTLGSGFLWSFGVPRYRPGLRDGETYGLDVSRHQGMIDWAAVASNNISFAYLKATEGGDHQDKRFEANASAAKAAGLRTGAYHFFTFCRSGKDQARNFLRKAPPTDGWLSPAVDIEFAGNCAKRPTETELIRELTIFIKIVEAAWNRPMLAYVLHDVADRYPAIKELDAGVWQRHLFTRPNNDEWAIWQVSGFAKVNGIDGPVDLNVGKLPLLTSINEPIAAPGAVIGS